MYYKFLRNVQSMATGRTYRAGAIMPDGLYSATSINGMLKAGDLAEVRAVVETPKPPVVVKEVDVPVVDAPVVDAPKYDVPKTRLK